MIVGLLAQGLDPFRARQRPALGCMARRRAAFGPGLVAEDLIDDPAGGAAPAQGGNVSPDALHAR